MYLIKMTIFADNVTSYIILSFIHTCPMQTQPGVVHVELVYV